MAKRNSKIRPSQRDKYYIALAKRAKETGLLSKQANLHSGRHISRGVLAKVKTLEASIKLNYTAVKVPKLLAKAAKERGFQVVQGNRIIGPMTPQFRNRLKKGELTGVRPVKGGMMEEIILPHTVYDLRSLVEQLKDGIDTLKLPEEQFAFRYKGGTSFRAFKDSEDLLEYLLHYKGIADMSASRKPEELQEEYEGLTIFRLHEADIRKNIPTNLERRKAATERRAAKIRNGEYVLRRKRPNRAEWLENMPDWKRNKILAKEAAKKADYMKRLMDDPAKLAAHRERQRETSKKWRQNQKKK